MNRVITFISVIGVVAAAIAGAAAGVALGERASEPGTQTLTVLDPTLALDEGPNLTSPGGFTGFEGAPALTGRVFRTGAFEALDGDTAYIASSSGALDLQIDSTARLLRLGPLAGALQPGDTVLIRYEDDEPVAILRVPSDLRSPTAED